MRTVVVGFLAVLIVSGLSGCVGGGGSLNVDEPKWLPGYSFSYKDQGSYEMAVASKGETHSEDGKFGPLYSVIEVMNTTLMSGDTPIYLFAGKQIDRDEKEAMATESAQATDLAVPSFLPPLLRDQGPNLPMFRNSNIFFGAVRQADLQDIPAWLDIREECNGADCTANVQGLHFGDAPEWRFLDFPLKKGKTWTFTMEDQGVEDMPDGLSMKMTAKVMGRSTVDLPTGSTKAVRVDFSFKPINLEGYKDKVREDAQQEDNVKLTKFDLALSQSATAWYAEEYQTVVKTTFKSEFEVSVRGTDNGEKFDFTQKVRTEGNHVLDGARLIPRIERDLDYLARLYLGKVPLNDPTGTGVSAVSYTLDVAASATEINVAEPKKVDFTAKPIGVERLPETDSVHWKIKDATGAQVADGAGLQFAYEFKEPGEFSIEAEAKDQGGNITAADGLVIAANFEKEINVDCPVFAMEPQVRGCASEPVPVRAGIRSLTVSATVTGTTVPAVSVSTLRLSEPGKKVHTDNSASGGEYSITLNEFYGSVVTKQDWTMQLYQNRGVNQDAKYKISLLYSSPAAKPMMSSGGQDAAPEAPVSGFVLGF